MVWFQFLFLFLLSACCSGRWTFTAFKFMKKALETLDGINHKRLESQREYKVDRLVRVFLKSRGFNISPLIGGKPVSLLWSI